MEPVRSNELRSFFTYVVEVLEKLDIPYMVVGGFAAIFYGAPRLTIDVDIVVDMQLQHIRAFVQSFSPPTYYVSEDGIRESLLRRYPFNVIEPSTGAKVDLVPLPADLFSRFAFQRRRQMQYDQSGRLATFITPEDIILAKLMTYRETGSEKHLQDVRGVLLMQWDELNWNAVNRGARGAGVEEQLEALVRVVKQELGLENNE